ncbi:hypothetical protein GCM10017744_038710 [Streptomyces antimycoticus]|uniref:Uncharacterized protein n=1 Tax=Streptomyces antimycoticus TaxID=68175 RepID=A0A4D4K950_9ACTN|nr:hypothetical protein SANT12839_063870 [Streptomyces antimycoticus]
MFADSLEQRFVHAVECAETFVKEMEFVGDLQPYVPEPLRHRTPLLPAPEDGAPAGVGGVAVPRAEGMRTAEQDLEGLVLAKLRELVDGADEHGGRPAVDVVVHSPNRENTRQFAVTVSADVTHGVAWVVPLDGETLTANGAIV